MACIIPALLTILLMSQCIFLPQLVLQGGEKKEQTYSQLPTTANEHCYLSHLEAMSVSFQICEATSFSYHEQQHQVSLLEAELSPFLQTAQFCSRSPPDPFILPSLFYLLLQPRHPKKETAWKEWPLHFFTNISEGKLDIRYVLMVNKTDILKDPASFTRAEVRNSRQIPRKLELWGILASQAISMEGQGASTKTSYITLPHSVLHW